MTKATNATETESTPAVLQRLLGNILALLQGYAGYLGQEARLTVRDVAIGAGLLALAFLCVGLVFTLLVATLILVLAIWLAPWAAALVVAAVIAVIMAVLVVLGLRLLRPRRLARVTRSFVEDVRWLRTELLKS